MTLSLTMRLFFFAMMAAMLFGSSCSHYYYAPNTVNIPFVKERNDAQISVRGSAGPLRGMEVQTSWSPVNHLAVMYNFYRVNTRARNTFEGDWGKGGLHEGGLGGYWTKNDNIFSLYSGWGRGFSENSFAGGAFVDLNLQRLFIQPGYAYEGKGFRYALGCRFSRIHFTSGKTIQLTDQQEITTIKKLDAQSPFWMPELHVSTGMRVSPFTLSFSGTLLQSPRINELGFAKANLSLGLSVDLHELWKKTGSKPATKKSAHKKKK